MDDTLEEKTSIAEQFSALPEGIKKWLASEELVFVITEIETKLGLDDEKILVIPNLILRLVVQDMEPQDFIGELSNELGVAFPVARTIAEDIERNALQPIAAELRNKTGLEVKLIYYSKPENASAAPGRATEQVQMPQIAPRPAQFGQIPPEKISSPIGQEKQMSPLTFTATPVPPSASALSRTPKEELPMPPVTPFILHQESPTVAPTLNQKPQETSLPKTNLTMKVQNYFQSATAPERPAQKPISIRIETPASPQPAQQVPMAKSPAAQTAQIIPPTQTPSSTPLRVVHYSNLRTPITNLGAPKKEVDKDNVVDLRKFM